MNKEKRKFPRRIFESSLGVLSKGIYYTGVGVEIGEGGMMFHINEEISESNRLLVSFRVPNHGFVVIQANVRNTRHDDGGFRYGIEFVDLAFENRRRIRDFIAEKTQDEADREKSSQVAHALRMHK
ncbi:MAG: PilZ domain-containing protein [Bdellovibrionota bacterium]|nr:PilZ domain-containing protein [Bdellovibrionota bacterium]